MGLSADDLLALLEAFDASSWQELVVEVDGDSLHVSRRSNGASAAAAVARHTDGAAPRVDARPTAEQQSPPPSAPPSGAEVLSPSIGLFWRSPAPGAPPFVEVGSRITAGDTVGILEVMKLMSPITADNSGIVTAVLVENGAMVEHGQALVLVAPD